jgi:hypothetical protein
MHGRPDEAASRETCRKGHLRKLHGARNSRGVWVCVPCRREYERQWWAKRKGRVADALMPAGVSARSLGAQIMWANRRDQYGDTGWTDEGKRRFAEARKRQAKQRKWCRKKLHRWVAGQRTCHLCRLVWEGRAKTAARVAADLAPLREEMIALGIRSNQQPESAYWRQRYEAARERWKGAKAEAEGLRRTGAA